MLPFPRNRPIFENLDTSYILVNRLLDHFRAALGHVVIHFRGPSTEGVLFFNPHGVINAALERGGEKIVGERAAEELLACVQAVPHALSIYALPPENAHYWANAPLAQPVREGVASSDTDIVELIEKLGEERLTGYLHVTIAEAQENAFLIFDGGVIVCASYFMEEAGEDNEENLQLLIDKIDEKGAVFDIFDVSVTSREEKAEARLIAREQLWKALEGLLNHLEDVLGKNYADKPFSPKTAISRKFLEKADRYPFLDPFYGEILYTDHKLDCHTDAPAADVLQAMLEVARELVSEHSASDLFNVRMKQWKAHYEWVLRNIPP